MEGSLSHLAGDVESQFVNINFAPDKTPFSTAEPTASEQTTLAMEKYLCLTILGYRKPGMTEEQYRNHMVNISAPMTKGLMVKYGVKRWTQVSSLPGYELLLL